MYRTRAATGLLVGLAAVVGCFPSLTKKDDSTSRSQAADDTGDKDAVVTAGQKTIVGNADPIPVHGIGLVHNLRGTGSSPPPGEMRAVLENMILKAKGTPRELLDDPARNTSLVLVTAVIPPGARNGDKIDVAITLPAGSKTTSLKGGTLFPCDLANYELAGNVRNSMAASGMPVGKVPVASELTPLAGGRLALAEGSLLAGSIEPARAVPQEDSKPTLEVPEVAQLRAAKVWGGAKVMIDRPYYFILSDGSPQPRLALVIAERLNAVFHSAGDRFGKTAEAKVQGKPLVVAHVPPAYRLNHSRFLLVARQVPLVPIDGNHPYRLQLEHDLVRPETALTAAIKLEALGPDSRQPLRVGLQSESPWVRFAAAEALAYLGHPDGAKDLADLAEKHPSLRTHGLTALASMDDGASLDLLAQLMRKPDPTLRYGAFVALRTADPTHAAVRGRLMNRSYSLHEVTDETERPASDSVVHVNSEKRAELVLFGNAFPLRGEVSLPLGNEFTVTAKGDGTATVTRVTTKNGEPVAVPANCRADLSAVLAALADLGGTYAEAVDLVSRLEKADALAAKVAYDAAPRGLSVQHLAQIARSDPSLDKADLEVQRAGQSEVVAASYELPTEADAVQAKPAQPVEEPTLNREPGRLFGPKRPSGE